jgi:hypothetical protein
MKTLVVSTVMTLGLGATAAAQTDGTERLSIVVEASTVSSPGGEEVRVGGGANANEPGKMARHGFSLESDRCIWGVSRVVEADAALGWAVEITPVRVADDAVTFRLAWSRTRDEGKASTQPKTDTELTLRAGESMPLDSVYRPCPGQPRTVGQSLRVSVVRYPDPHYDRRLISLDLWLVEKLEDGSERSQPMSLRGLYHRPISFYFDSITQGALALDIFGEVTAAPGDRTSDVKIITRSRIFDPNQPPGRPFPRETTATLKITPNEVVSVQLPQVAGSSAFASRALSLRIRVRQLR